MEGRDERPVRGAGSSWVWAVAVNHVLLPPPLGVHNGRVPGLPWPPRGSGAAHGTTRRSATLAQMELTTHEAVFCIGGGEVRR